MRIERWYWFFVFCLLSLGVHVGLALQSHGASWSASPVLARPGVVEVTLEQGPPPKPDIKPVPAPKPIARPKTDFGVHRIVPPKRVEMALLPIRKKPPIDPQPEPKAPPVEKTEKTEKIVEKQVAEKSARIQPPDPFKATTATESDPKPPGGVDVLKDEKPLTAGAPVTPTTLSPRMARVANSETTLKVTANSASSGGSPAPDRTLTGKDGAAAPETPLEDTVYTGGGAGGQKLPVAPAKIGGGGGSTILTVNNPLAREVIPEDKPGLGPGTGGAAGTGTGGGVGFRAGKGIGTRRDGRDALATLKSKPGIGIGAGVGSRIGTNAPGGGKGTGAETPGTGGEGTGYGRGKGIDISEGTGQGGGTGGKSIGVGRLTGSANASSFGDLAGLLRGDPAGGGGAGGGPGGAGRGAGGGFGSAQQMPFALKGDIYLLEPGTSKLPDFNKMKSVGSIYTTELNMPTRHWDRGFPGVTDRFEWFAIDYNGLFLVKKIMTLKFKLSSDDGSKLFIDSDIVIDNDGLHSTQMREGSIKLLPGRHKIEVQYFQGPKDEIALVLDVSAE